MRSPPGSTGNSRSGRHPSRRKGQSCPPPAAEDTGPPKKILSTFVSGRAATKRLTGRLARRPFRLHSVQDIMEEEIRIDKWLWAVRIFKSRSDAAEACRMNRVTVNGSYCKPSRELREGDTVEVRKLPVTYSFRVKGLVSNRQPAKNVPLYADNITPQTELDKLNIPRETIFISRDRGTGRPTKKERREIDALMDGIYLEDD